MRIKAVLFDLGDTLLDFDFEHPAEIFQKVLASLGISRPLDEIRTVWLKAEKETSLPSLFGKLPSEEWGEKWNSLILKHLGIEESAKLHKTLHSKWKDSMSFTIYPETKDVLKELQQRGLKLGLISNGYEEDIYFFLERAGIEKTTFDIIVGVDTVQCNKPHPDIFKYALIKLKVRPEEALFVGDDVEVDYKGAENAGMYTLLIDRTWKQKQGDLKTIRNLKEILSHID
ncbi:MAG: HAD family hydrolase [Candidatus Bathyarchaeota archaeon]